MTYEGYLRVGGVEVVNTERARGYATTNDCPAYWIAAEECEGLQDALASEPYIYDNITSAPWYDRSLASLSSRFYGVVGLTISGASDSTRRFAATEGVTDGGSNGRSRKGMRSLRATATLLARGADALDYGSQWLSSVFDGGCGLHADACSMTDAEFLSACPPPYGTVPDFSPWTESRRNLIANPAFTEDTANWSFSGGSGALGSVARRPNLDPNIPMSGYGRFTVTTAGTWFRASSNTPVGSVTPGSTYTLSGWARGLPVDGAFRLIIQWRTAGGTNILESVAPNLLLTSSFTRYSLTATAPPLASYATVQFGRMSSAVNDLIDVTGVVFENEDSLHPYFDGSSAPVNTSAAQRRYSWLGANDASVSIEEIRQPIERAQTLEEYSAVVDTLRRYVHDVAVSGPITVSELDFDGDVVGRTVEFTISSERAWVYGKTRQLTLAPSLPTVMEDTPFNRIPYPSAELGSGSIVIARNLSANPSVETNATGWVATNSTISGASATPFVSGARSTELAAVGSASFRSRLVGDSGATSVTAAVSDLVAYQDVAIPAGTGRRISLNMWAAALILAGTSPNTVIQSLNVRYLFLNGGAAIGNTTIFGTAASGELGGNAYSLVGLAVPDAATHVRVSAAARCTWTSSATSGQNSDIRLFADALQVSIP